MPNEILAKRRANSLLDERIETRNFNVLHSTIRENLYCNISYLYGEKTLKTVKRFEKFRSRVSTLCSDLTFLIRCRNDNLLPTCTRLSYHLKTKNATSILKRASQALLREQIREKRRQIAITEKETFYLHLQLSNQTHPLLWSDIDKLSFWRAESDTNLKAEKLKRKLENIRGKDTRHTDPQLETKKVVHNLSTHHLTDQEESVLSKGFNYAVTPKSIPVENIISNVEVALDTMPEENAEKIRQDITQILRTSRPPKPNLKFAEWKALQALKKNKNITILPADKGNATVVLNTEDYMTKMETILQDDTYKKVTSDPTTYLEKTTKAKIKAANLGPELERLIIPREKSSRCPRLYGLPKIHKLNVPLRPIVSAVASPTQNLEKHLSRIMQPTVESADSYIKNSEHFTNIIRGIQLEENDILASLDIVSLYPSIPVDEALDKIAMNEDFPAHVVELSEHCLKSTYFVFNSQIYKQTDGAPMGSSLSPAIANLYMMYFETEALKNSPFKPKLWKRYVDDIFIIWPHGRNELDNFLAYLNGIHHRIQFTLEVEEEESLPFLDVLITRKNNGQLQYSVYRKPTHTNRYLNAGSHHHPSQIQSVANTLVSRSYRLTEPDTRQQEMTQITRALKQNGYKDQSIRKALERQRHPQTRTEEQDLKQSRVLLPYVKGVTDRIGRVLRKHNIGTTYKPQNTLANILGNPKDKRKLENHGVYSIPCGDCHKLYIGQTNRRISTRIQEHKRSIKNKQTTSALFQHHHDTGHNINFEGSKQIASISHYKTRIVREALEIEKNGQLNKRDDALNISTTWKSLLAKPRNNQNIEKATISIAPEPVITTNTGPQSTNTDARTNTPDRPTYNLRRRRPIKDGDHTSVSQLASSGSSSKITASSSSSSKST